MDHNDNALRAAIKSLTDVIAPAIDQTDALAKEQVRLVIDQLEFLRQRLDKTYDFERLKLQLNLAMARELLAIQFSDRRFADGLKDAVAGSADTFSRVGASLPALRAASAALSGAIRVLAREARTFPEADRKRIEKIIFDSTSEWIELERAWYLPFGFDPEAHNVKPLNELIPD